MIARLFLLTLLATSLLTVACMDSGSDVVVGPLESYPVSFRSESTQGPALVDLAVKAGEFKLRGGGADLLGGEVRTNVAEWAPELAPISGNGVDGVRVAQGGEADGMDDPQENTWDLQLGGELPIALKAALGAGRIHFDLRGVELHDVNVKLGAGELTVDLSGEHSRSLVCRVKNGAGLIRVRLPRQVPVRVRAENAVGAIDSGGLQERDGYFVNEGAPQSEVSLEVHAIGAVGKIQLELVD